MGTSNQLPSVQKAFTALEVRVQALQLALNAGKATFVWMDQWLQNSALQENIRSLLVKVPVTPVRLGIIAMPLQVQLLSPLEGTVKLVLSGHSKRRPKIGFQDR